MSNVAAARILPAGTEAVPMRTIPELFSERSRLQWLMWFEAGLARAQASLGIIPQAACEEINRRADMGLLSLADLAEERAKVGHPMVTLIHVWARIMENGAGEYIHYGATTADAFDTVWVLMLRRAAKLVIERLRANEEAMLALAKTHRRTPMIGRTLGRHALPITFGLKVASWMAENRRNIERLKGWLERTNTGIVSGAVGSYAALGARAFSVEARTMAELGLGEPDPVDWKGTKDKYAEYGMILALIAKSTTRMAQEIFLLQSDDIRELSESTNRVGSSTMPHKENPARCTRIIAAGRVVPRLADVLLDWMVSIHERDQISNEDVLGQVSVALDAQINMAGELLANLRVYPDRMRKNLGATRGMIMTENLMMVLADKIGKQTAHDVLNEISVDAWAKGLTLIQAVEARPDIAGHFAKGELARELNPLRYLGQSPQAVDRTVKAINRARRKDPV